MAISTGFPKMDSNEEELVLRFLRHGYASKLLEDVLRKNQTERPFQIYLELLYYINQQLRSLGVRAVLVKRFFCPFCGQFTEHTSDVQSWDNVVIVFFSRAHTELFQCVSCYSIWVLSKKTIYRNKSCCEMDDEKKDLLFHTKKTDFVSWFSYCSKSIYTKDPMNRTYTFLDTICGKTSYERERFPKVVSSSTVEPRTGHVEERDVVAD